MLPDRVDQERRKTVTNAVEERGKIERHPVSLEHHYFLGAGAAGAGRGAAGAAGRGAAAAGAAGRAAGAAGAAATGAAASKRRITSLVRSRPASAQMIPASSALNRIS